MSIETDLPELANLNVVKYFHLKGMIRNRAIIIV